MTRLIEENHKLQQRLQRLANHCDPSILPQRWNNTDGCTIHAAEDDTNTIIGSFPPGEGQQVSSEGPAVMGCSSVQFEFEATLEASRVYRRVRCRREDILHELSRQDTCLEYLLQHQPCRSVENFSYCSPSLSPRDFKCKNLPSGTPDDVRRPDQPSDNVIRDKLQHGHPQGLDYPVALTFNIGGFRKCSACRQTRGTLGGGKSVLKIRALPLRYPDASNATPLRVHRR